MPQPKRDDEPTNREKQLAHGAQSDQGRQGQRIQTHGEKDVLYEGPEESQQQRRAEQTNQPRTDEERGIPPGTGKEE